MGSFQEDDGLTDQSASALPLSITAEVAGSYPEQFLMESHDQEAFQPHPGRELYSKEQWEAQKPVIRQLYNLENKPFKLVIDILRSEHNFFPTYSITILLFHRIKPYWISMC
jgi:hypothetical protein